MIFISLASDICLCKGQMQLNSRYFFIIFFTLTVSRSGFTTLTIIFFTHVTCFFLILNFKSVKGFGSPINFKTNLGLRFLPIVFVFFPLRNFVMFFKSFGPGSISSASTGSSGHSLKE